MADMAVFHRMRSAALAIPTAMIQDEITVSFASVSVAAGP